MSPAAPVQKSVQNPLFLSGKAVMQRHSPTPASDAESVRRYVLRDVLKSKTGGHSHEENTLVRLSLGMVYSLFRPGIL